MDFQGFATSQKVLVREHFRAPFGRLLDAFWRLGAILGPSWAILGGTWRPKGRQKSGKTSLKSSPAGSGAIRVAKRTPTAPQDKQNEPRGSKRASKSLKNDVSTTWARYKKMPSYYVHHALFWGSGFRCSSNFINRSDANATPCPTLSKNALSYNDASERFA